MEYAEISKIMGMLAKAFPRYKADKETVEVYYRLLRDLPRDILEASAVECAATRDFFPSVHELRATAMEIQRRVVGIPTAYEAWREVLDLANKEVWFTGGVVVPGLFSHPLVERTARLLGWPGNFPTSDEIGVDRAHFTKAYDEQLRVGMADAGQLPEVRAYIEKARSSGAPMLLAEVIRERSFAINPD